RPRGLRVPAVATRELERRDRGGSGWRRRNGSRLARHRVGGKRALADGRAEHSAGDCSGDAERSQLASGPLGEPFETLLSLPAFALSRFSTEASGQKMFLVARDRIELSTP